MRDNRGICQRVGLDPSRGRSQPPTQAGLEPQDPPERSGVLAVQEKVEGGELVEWRTGGRC